MKQQILISISISIVCQNAALADRSAPASSHASHSSGVAAHKGDTPQSRHERAQDLVAQARRAYSEHPPQFEKAIQLYRESLKVEDAVMTRQKLAQMLKFAERYDEAEEEYEKVRQMYRKNPQLLPRFYDRR